MTFDYPESNPFCTSSGSALNQLEWITRYLESESDIQILCFHLPMLRSGERGQFESKTLTAVITDPTFIMMLLHMLIFQTSSMYG